MSISNLPVEGSETPGPKDQPTSEVSESSAVSVEQNPSELSTNTKSTEATPTPVAETAQLSVPPKSSTNQNTEQQTANVSAAPTAATQTQPVAEKSQYDQITEALLARTSVNLNISKLKILLYGPPGGTKSSTLSQIPHLFCYATEDGLISMATQEHYTGKPRHPHQLVMPFKSFQESDLLAQRFADQIPELAEWEVFGIDTFSTFYKKSLQQIQGKREAIRPTGTYKNEDDDYKEANPHMMAFLDKMLAMDRHLIITAHERTVEPKNKPAKTYPDFSESLAQKIEAMMDIVGHISMMEIDGFDNPVPVMRVISDGTTHAKTRIPLPATIINPTWPQLHAVWLEWKQKIEANQ